MATTIPPPFTLDNGTLFALGVAFSLMPAAQALAALCLPQTTPTRYYYLFLWHAYDFLTHFILEGSFLYHCFFTFLQLPSETDDFPHPASKGGDYIARIYNRHDRRYGVLYSQQPMAKIWQEYAKADKRWAGADLTVISLEILTVGLAGPAAVYVCYQIAKLMRSSNPMTQANTVARLWFVAIMLATGELYGGFMTFAPEWLSGNTQLAGDDPVYLWLYLVFFNVLWVFIPFWVLYQAYSEVSLTFRALAANLKKKHLN